MTAIRCECGREYNNWGEAFTDHHGCNLTQYADTVEFTHAKLPLLIRWKNKIVRVIGNYRSGLNT